MITVLFLFLFCLNLISCRTEEPLFHSKQDVSFLLERLNSPFSYKPICFGGRRFISFVSREGPLVSDTSYDGRHKCYTEQEECRVKHLLCSLYIQWILLHAIQSPSETEALVYMASRRYSAS